MTGHTRTALALLLLPLAGPALAQEPAPSPAPSAAAADGVTLAQYQAEQQARMMAADTDHDGRISLAEWTAAMAARHAGHGDGHGGGHGDGQAGGHGGGDHGGGYDPSRLFDRIDANHDGYLDKSEIDAASAERFRRMDANNDGIVTPDERLAGRGGAGHGGGHWHGDRDGAGQ